MSSTRVRAAVSTVVACLLLAVGLSPGTAHAGGGHHPRPPARLPLTEAQFNAMFPDRLPFYTYAGLVDVLKTYPAFANTGSPTIRKREIAAFLAHVNHESGALIYLETINKDTWPIFCDTTQVYGCPAGVAAYHGRGPIMLSWNFNYKAAGDAIGVDLLHHPELVGTDPAVAWTSAVWYWMSQTGGGALTSHDAIVTRAGFAETIRSINSPECNGGNTPAVEHRVAAYQRFAAVLHTSVGRNLTC
jgi:predicted chitinase